MNNFVHTCHKNKSCSCGWKGCFCEFEYSVDKLPNSDGDRTLVYQCPDCGKVLDTMTTTYAGRMAYRSYLKELDPNSFTCGPIECKVEYGDWDFSGYVPRNKKTGRLLDAPPKKAFTEEEVTRLDIKSALADIEQEVLKAKKNFPDFHSQHEAYAVIMEEVEELWEEIKKNQKNYDIPAQRKEATQAAAMLVRLIVELL